MLLLETPWLYLRQYEENDLPEYYKLLADRVNRCKERGAEMFAPPGKLCVDNGAMIAWTGNVMYASGTRMSLNDTVVEQRFRTDEVDITWR